MPAAPAVLLVRTADGHVGGVRVVPTQDAAGAHVVLALRNAHGEPVLGAHRVAFCVDAWTAAQQVDVPLDGRLGAEERAQLDAAHAVEVVSLHVGSPCLRQGLRAERMVQPRE